jgi:glycosyltransferase involved in cell wall biosynthesis
MTTGRATNLNPARIKDNPKVSVIAIFLNAERFIAEAIDSVLTQGFGDWELILVDDGSGEACASIARDYAKRYSPFVLYVDHEGHQNRGMSASRNLGLSHATGDYVSFIDADDVWTPEKLREQIAIMDAHPALGMVCGSVRYWHSWNGGQDSVIPTGHVHDQIVHPPEALLALYPLGAAAAPCPSDLLLRREAVSRVGGFEEHFTGPNQMYEDQGFLAKLYLSTPVYFSSRVWLNYRQHADSCVSEVKRDGHYDAVRHYFLTWFEAYLTKRTAREPRVEAALRRALWRYRHPGLYSTLQFARGFTCGGRQIASKIIGYLRGRML